MKKVGILTLYYKNDNYGGIAQAFALQKYVELLGYDAEVISYRRTSGPLFNGDKRGFTLTYIGNKLYKFPQKAFLKLKNSVAQKKYYLILKSRIDKRKNAFEISREIVKHTEVVYTDETINQLANEYDCFISGSDQIWKPIVVRDAYVGGFLPENKKKISYASSIAVTKFPADYSLFMKEKLGNYSWISVRENEAKFFLENLLNRSVDVVVDPTLLLPSSFWNKMASKRLVQGDYVFSYLLGQSNKQRSEIQKYATRNGLKLVTLPHIEGRVRACDINYGDEQLYDITLCDFFSLIKYAKVIITDSFHAVVFSIIFQKVFYAYERESFQRNGGTVSRLSTLLANLKIESYLISVNSEMPMYTQKIDYQKVNAELDLIIKKSQDLLKRALNDEDNI